MKTNTMFLRDAAPSDGAGAPPLPKSLAELDSPSPEDLAAAAQRQADQAAADAAAEAARVAAEAVAAEGVNEDGSLKDGYEKNADGLVVKTVAPPDDDDDNPPAGDGSFWDDVDALRGEKFEINWAEHKDADGNPIDPESPQGAYIREKAIAVKAAEDFETYLKQTDPRGYAYLLHRQAGGSDEDFLTVQTANLPEYDAFKTSVDSQSSLYKQSLVSRGLDADLAQLQVDKAIKDGKLFELADKEYRYQQSQNENQLREYEAKNKAAQDAYTQNVNKLNASLTTTIQENKGMNFIVPDTDKAAFTAFVKSNIRYENETGKFSIVQELGDDNSKLLESMFLLFKKGNLKDLVQRAATTQNTKKLKRVVEKTITPAEGKETGSPQKGGFVPLGNI